ncbi:MAG: restriction endonuclease subunit S [Lentisphaeria bacterium]
MKVKSLNEITNPKQWKNLPISKLKDSGFPVYGANGIIGFFDEYNHANPTIAITCRGATCGNIHITRENSYITSNAMALDDLDENECELNYLAQYLRYRGLSDVTTGAAQPQITRANLEKVTIPLPPLDDQIRIAHLLGKVEGLIARRKQHLQQLDDLLKSVFLEMFGDPVRNEKGWVTKTLPQLVLPGKNSLKRGPFGGALKKEIFVETGYLVYEQNHALNNDYSFARYFVTEEKYQELIDFKVVPGDVLISCSGVYLGKLSIVPADAKPGIINQALLKVSLDPRKIRHRFFVHVFGSPQFKGKYFPSNRGGAIPNLPPMSVMKEIPFIYPPLELQQDFTDLFEKVEWLKSQYQQSLTDLESLYGVVSQQAFKGELDLSRVPLPTMPPEGEQPMAIELSPPQTEEIAINLPDNELMLIALENPEQRPALLGHWLEAYRGQLGDAPFSLERFMAAAQTRLSELHPDTDFELGSDDYEHIKTWAFEALASGKLMQVLDDDENLIKLRKRSDQWGSW